MKSLYSFISSLNNFLQIMFINKKFKEVVIFSENHRYYYVFFELIEKLKKENKNFIYVTSDIQDTYDFGNLGKCFYIGKGLAFILFVNFISCKNLIMTLTDLKNNKFKKSLFCKNFIYIFHSLMSTHKTYTEGAFDNYDIIFACGQYQKDEIRKREKLKKLKRKTIIVSGYLYLDYLVNYKNKFNLNNKEKTILIAPSWNMDGKDLINNNIENIIEKILEKYNVILRPHPESFKRSESKLKDIQKKFSRNKKFKLDTNSSNVESMALSDILITDGSGISMEFLFYKKQPVIYLETENLEKIHNPNYELISKKTFQEDVQDDLGINLNILNNNEFISVIDNCFQKDFLNNFKEKTEKYFKHKFPEQGKTAENIYKNLFSN